MLDLFASLGRMSLTTIDQQVQGIPAQWFARQPEVDGQRVATNHPAFIVGHLALYPHRMATLLQQQVDGIEVPESWRDLFNAGRQCRDDPQGTIYPPGDELVAVFTRGMEAIIAAFDQGDPQQLDAPFPVPKLRDRFPTVGVAVGHMIAGHVQFHCGQLSMWRRVMGLGPTR